MTTTTTGISRIIDMAGGTQALAKQLGVSHQVVYNWRTRGYVPPARAIELEGLYIDVQREELVSPAMLALLT
jgi:DNA-binding transcriptional regulator YdaS (Cro superfamily)